MLLIWKKQPQVSVAVTKVSKALNVSICNSLNLKGVGLASNDV